MFTVFFPCLVVGIGRESENERAKRPYRQSVREYWPTVCYCRQAGSWLMDAGKQVCIQVDLLAWKPTDETLSCSYTAAGVIEHAASVEAGFNVNWSLSR